MLKVLKILLYFCGLGVALVLLLFPFAIRIILAFYSQYIDLYLLESSQLNDLYRSLFIFTADHFWFAATYGIIAVFSGLISSIIFWILIKQTYLKISVIWSASISNIAPVLGYALFIIAIFAFTGGIRGLTLAIHMLGAVLLLLLLIQGFAGIVIGWLISKPPV